MFLLGPVSSFVIPGNMGIIQVIKDIIKDKRRKIKEKHTLTNAGEEEG